MSFSADVKNEILSFCIFKINSFPSSPRMMFPSTNLMYFGTLCFAIFATISFINNVNLSKKDDNLITNTKDKVSEEKGSTDEEQKAQDK